MKGVQDALTRLSGVKKVTVLLQDGLVIATTDPNQPVLPAGLWQEIARVGFKPAGMKINVRSRFEDQAIVVDGKRWPVSGPVPGDKGSRLVRLKVKDGGKDPPEVEVMK